VIPKIMHTTHALPTPRACAANGMLVSSAYLYSLLGCQHIILGFKKMGF
jgi:hypothetical protein